MAIATTDIKCRLSTQSGTAGNSTAQANPNNSLGKYISTTDKADGANGLFDNISGAENAASTVDYRCFFLLNNHATLTLQGAKVWIDSQVSGGATVQIGLDPAGVVAKGASTAQAAAPASETTAPSGVTFSNPNSGSPLSIGDIPAGSCVAVWVKRAAANTGAVNNDGWTLGWSGDTAA